MKFFRIETNLEKSLIILYFSIGLLEIGTEFSDGGIIQYGIRLLITLVLAVLYWYTSNKKNVLFFMNIGFLLIGRLFIIPNEMEMLYYALIAVFFHRIIEVYYISKLIKLKDYVPPVLAGIPFLIFFLYSVSGYENVLIKSYVILVIHIVLISLISGIILSQYLCESRVKKLDI